MCNGHTGCSVNCVQRKNALSERLMYHFNHTIMEASKVGDLVRDIPYNHETAKAFAASIRLALHMNTNPPAWTESIYICLEAHTHIQ